MTTQPAAKPQFANDLPPLPFSYLTNAPEGAGDGVGHVYLLDANGRKIGALWGKPSEKIALAELICDASDAALARSAS